MRPWQQLVCSRYAPVVLVFAFAIKGSLGADEGHWAFQTPVRPAVPSLADDTWVRTTIDAFVLRRLREDGVEVAAPASRARLIRRASLDLLGLPPTRDEVAAFLADTSPDAWSRVVERLLASPRYGERWGRHWLDLARYADSNGFEFDFERPHAWHYRDYVIKSLNADKPYDRFVVEQLAGDEVAPHDFQAVVATGFCRHGPTVGNQTLEKNRYDELDDVISTASEVFLGLTLGCARCHDHKYDPIPQRDYYAMLAIFHSSEKRQRLMGTAEQAAEKSRIEREIREARAQVKQLSNAPTAGRWRWHGGELSQDAIAPNVRLLFGDADWTDYTLEVEFQKTGGTTEPFNYDAGVYVAFRATDFTDSYRVHLGASDNREHAFEVEAGGGRAPILPKVGGSLARDRWYRIKVTAANESLRVWLDDSLLFNVRDRRHPRGGIGLVNWLTTTRWRNLRIVAADGEVLLDGFPEQKAVRRPSEVSSVSTRDSLNAKIAALERKKAILPIAMSIGESSRKPRETRLFVRGDYRTPDEIVEPGVPSALAAEPLSFPPAPADAKTTGQRRRLAEWMVSDDNPVVARVMVNRIWQYHFGRGLVDTPSNFGVVGTPPSHPELLDWLALEFLDSGWSIKHLHRLIMTSSVYRLSSESREKTRQADLDNRLLSRFSRRRVTAEVLRDRILAASGSLNLRQHGPGIRPRIHPSVIATSTTRKWPTVAQEGPKHWRRSVYIFTRRSVLVPMLEAFDAPATTESCDRRQSTTVPTQALQLMNDEFTEEQAALMSADIIRQVGDELLRQVDEVYWRALARAPDVAERQRCIDFVQQQRDFHAHGDDAAQLALADLSHVMFNLNEFVYLD